MDDTTRSWNVFPAGSNGEFGLPRELSLVIDRGEGCHVVDASGRRYLDFSMGWGSALVGHAHPRIVEAVRRQVGQGANFSHVNARSLELAERIVALSPCCEQVRFCASGTEATMYCQRLARAATGRAVILKFEGAYHGANEIGVTSLFPADPPAFPEPDFSSSAGVEPIARGNVLVAPFNDADAARRIIERYADVLAAVIVEPLQRCLPPEPGFLGALREATLENGVLLIFDEVVTGFRLALGGAQAYYGVAPDLVAYGKALGGGLPIGAFGGSRTLMSMVREDRLGGPDYMWMASSHGGNPVSAAAALVAIEVLAEPGSYEKLHELGRGLRAGLAQAIEGRGLRGHVLGDGPLAAVALTDDRPYDYRSGRSRSPQLARRIMLGLFARGVFVNPMGTKLYLSLAHDVKACDRLIDIFSEAADEAVSRGREEVVAGDAVC